MRVTLETLEGRSEDIEVSTQWNLKITLGGFGVKLSAASETDEECLGYLWRRRTIVRLVSRQEDMHNTVISLITLWCVCVCVCVTSFKLFKNARNASYSQ